MQYVVKKPSRDFTAVRSRIASSSTTETACRASLRACGSLGTSATSSPSSGRCRSVSRTSAIRSARMPTTTEPFEASSDGGAQRAGQRRTGHGPGGDGTGDRGGVEARVGQAEPQRVDVAHEAGVDDGDPLVGGDGGEERLGVGRVGGDPHVEAERPQIALERRPGDRLTGEDGGRQTNSLLWVPAYADAGHVRAWWGRPRPGTAGQRVGRGYRMMGSGRSPPVHGPINTVCRAASAAIIIVDPGPGPQTTADSAAIHGIAPVSLRSDRTGIGWAPMTWLITGGAGYIGAHVVRAMAGAGERVVALDDLSAGVPARLPDGHSAGPGLVAGRGAAEAGASPSTR